MWERRLPGGSVWSPIAGAVSSSYRPSDGDVGSDLRVTASYTDGQGSGKSVQALVPNAVLAAPPMNRAPAFPTGPRPERSVAENTGPGENIGEPVEASDADGDELSYMLGGADAASFEIDEVSGQLQTSDALNYEDKSSYRVTVTAADTSGETAVTDVTILLINEDEDGALTLSSRQPQVGTSADSDAG